MSRRKLVHGMLGCLVTLSMLLTACGGTNQTAGQTTATTGTAQAAATEGKPDPFGKYEEPVELTACRVLTTWMGFDDQEDENNNWWSKAYLDQLGIKLNVVWTAPNWGEPYEQKINTALATDDLPDIIPIYYNYALKIAQAGKAADIKEAFDKYASDFVKSNLQIANGIPYQNCFYDGKMFGVASVGTFDRTSRMIWIRKDWLEKLNLPVPKNLGEVENAARAFISNNMGGKNTIGISMNKDFGDMEGLLELYGGFERGWIEKDGQLVYSGIQPEVKNGLGKLAEWYKEGLLAKDFATKDPNNEEQADIVSGKVGIVFAGDHAPNGGGFRDEKKNNPDSDWVFVPLLDANGTPVKQMMESRAGDFTVVSSKCKNPEAVIKLINMASQVFSDEKPDFVADNEYDSTKGGNMSWWNAVVAHPDDIDQGRKDWEVVRKAIKDGVTDASALKNTSQRIYFEQMTTWLKEGTKAKDFDLLWSLDKLSGEGGSMIWTQANYDQLAYFNKLTGPDTDAMVKNGADWNTKHKEYWIKGIMSGKVDEEFNNWVDYWKQNGGDAATREINEWYAKNK